MTATAAPASSTLRLSKAQLDQYKADGYTVVKSLIPAEIMAAVKRELLELMHGRYEGWDVGHFQVADPRKYRAPNGNLMPGGVQGPAVRGGVFRDVADHPSLVSAMSQLLGGPVERYTDQCLIKSAWVRDEQGGRTFYHQDSYYWLLKPESGCNAWISCDEVGRDAIALAIKPGTHRAGKLDPHEDYFDEPAWCNARTLEPFKRHRIPLSSVDYSDEVLIPLSPGDAVFFTNYTWHRSEPNRTGEHLCAYAIAYQLAGKSNKFEADPRKK